LTDRSAPRAVLAAPAHAQVQHLAGVGAGGQQRMVAEHLGVAVGRPALGVAVDLADGGVHIDGDRLLGGAGPSGPRAGEQGLGHAVELADVAEGERAQERADGGWGHHLVAEHLGGGARA
jgi:hypothetical protein